MNRFALLASMLVAWAVLCGAGSPVPHAAPLLQQEAATEPPSDLNALFVEANRAFADAVALRETDPAESDELLDRAIELYHEVRSEGDIHNGRLEYNLANAYLLRGDVGTAILHYRRGEELMPGNENLRSNLAFARSQVPDRIPLDTGSHILRTLFFLHYDVPSRFRLWALVSTFAFGWTVMLFGMLRGSVRTTRWVLLASLVLSGSFLTSLLVERHQDGQQTEGVIIAKALIGRKGPDVTGYEPSFMQPLHAGVEFEIIEERNDWVLAKLRDGRETWLPRNGIGVI